MSETRLDLVEKIFTHNMLLLDDARRLIEVARAASDPLVLEALEAYEDEWQSLAGAHRGDDDYANNLHANIGEARERLEDALEPLLEEAEDD